MEVLQVHVIVLFILAELEEAVPYLGLVATVEVKVKIMDTMGASAPEAAAEKEEQALETVEKVEMELFGFFDKISQNQFTKSQKIPI